MKNFRGKLKSFSSKRILYFDYALLISTKIMNVFQMRIVFKFQIITISYRFYGRKQFNIKNKVYQFIDFEDLQILTTNERNLWSIVKHCNPVQGQNSARTRFSLCSNSHREKPVFITGNPSSHCRDPVFITGNGFAVHVLRQLMIDFLQTLIKFESRLHC